MERVKPAIDKAYAKSPYGGPAYFEVLIAMGFLYFKRQKCDWAILEVGMGGRFDATNVIENKQAAIITNIGYDHTEALGRTLTKIAWEKAGIIKKGVKFWTAEQRPHLLKIFAKECRKYGVKFNQVLDRAKNYNDLNRELVKSAALDLGFNERSVKRGLKDLRLPARFETVQTNPKKNI